MPVAVLEKEPRLKRSFKENLRRIAQLEEEHNFLGVRFSLREGVRGSKMCAEELAEHVCAILERAVELSKKREDLEFVEPYPAQ